MRTRLLLLGLILFTLCIGVMGQVKTIYVTSYGAKPNDKISDQIAFEKIARLINTAKGNIKLIFPAGVYTAGPKYRYNKSKPAYPSIAISNVFSLTDCKNVSFEGIGKVTIRFENNIPFGIFPEKNAAVKKGIDIGALFYFTGCSGMSLKNIAADGNNEKMMLLDNWGVGNNPYEGSHDGLFLLNCQGVHVENCSFNNFGRDGALLLQDADQLPTKDIAFLQCNFNGNGRNGFSWCGGENVRFEKCFFKNNSIGRIKTNPGAGLDIEPERNALCSKGIFKDCEFSGNGGYAVTSGYTTASEVLFDNCRIIGNSNYSFYNSSPKFKVVNSFIAGTSLIYYDAGIVEEGTEFNNCIFTDSVPGKKIYILNYVTGVVGQNVRFSDCTFNSYIAPIMYIELLGKKTTDTSGNTFFKKCRFNAYFKKPTTWGKNAFVGSNVIFEDCIFKSLGYADFSVVLGEKWRKIYQRRNIIIN